MPAKFNPSKAKGNEDALTDADTLPPEELVSDADVESLDDVEVTSSGLGPESAGQSGDTQGLAGLEDSNSESVKELIEEGQYYEASVVSGIENVPDADKGPIKTRQIQEDDVPAEYLEESEFRK